MHYMVVPTCKMHFHRVEPLNGGGKLPSDYPFIIAMPWYQPSRSYIDWVAPYIKDFAFRCQGYAAMIYAIEPTGNQPSDHRYLSYRIGLTDVSDAMLFKLSAPLS